jgi:hypothetical protein
MKFDMVKFRVPWFTVPCIYHVELLHLLKVSFAVSVNDMGFNV